MAGAYTAGAGEYGGHSSCNIVVEEIVRKDWKSERQKF